MKQLAITLLTCFVFTGLFAQTNEQNNFTPHKKLLKKEKWDRVSEFRFEDAYNYMAIEWQNDTYVLMDMGTERKVHIRSADCKTVFFVMKEIGRKRFKPVTNLRNTDIWKRVNMFRFESKGLQLIVEWDQDGKTYVLFSLNNPEEQARSHDFLEIEKAISQLTNSESF